MSTLVSSLFRSRASAEYAVVELVKAGFSPGEISLLMSDRTRRREFAGSHDAERVNELAAGEPFASAGVAGLGIQRPLAFADSRFVGSGPIVTALASPDPDAPSQGLADALIGLGIPEHEARSLQREIRHGRIMVGVLLDEDPMPGAEHPRREWNREELEEVERLA
ncbi:MAG TPA: hypothetical protein VMJ70_01775 [Candidatus Sulfotelmatobacter sp.]|nr:hypothetical protein [Candidatus Sulfotelmatobacter sp.]